VNEEEAGNLGIAVSLDSDQTRGLLAPAIAALVVRLSIIHQPT